MHAPDDAALPGKKQSIKPRVAPEGSHLLLQGGIKRRDNLVYPLANIIEMLIVCSK